MNCVGSLTRSDPEVEVRRAAAMFVHKLLEGLGADGLKVNIPVNKNSDIIILITE